MKESENLREGIMLPIYKINLKAACFWIFFIPAHNFSRALYTDNSRATRDTEELNPIFKICNQNAEPSTTYPLSPSFSFPAKHPYHYLYKFSRDNYRRSWP